MLLGLLFACFDPNADLRARALALESEQAADAARISELEARVKQASTMLAVVDALMPMLDPSAPVPEPGGRSTESSNGLGPDPADGRQDNGARCTEVGGAFVLPLPAEMPIEVVSGGARSMEHRDESGRVNGYRVFGIRRDSLGKSCGFQNGDVIRSVAGVNLDSKSAAQQAWSRVQTERSFTVPLDRRRDPINLVFRRGE